MEVIRVDNVHQALPEGCDRLLRYGRLRPSRNGPVIVFPNPWTTVYYRPTQRVVFWPERDANPFFHLAEALWMLDGRNDVEWIQKFNSQIGQFSDDGVTFNAAYGHRWRRYFGADQLDLITKNLRKDRHCRRQVLTMWTVRDLAHQETKDVPCNTQAFFQIDNDALNMMVTNRSNDLIWGAYGANAVHFSVLQEVLSARIGVLVGRYTQTSMNTHIYERHFNMAEQLATQVPNVFARELPSNRDPYHIQSLHVYPLVAKAETWMDDLGLFMTGATRGFRNPFFGDVALPLFDSWQAFVEYRGSADRIDRALEPLKTCQAPDWSLAAREWLERRRNQ